MIKGIVYRELEKTDYIVFTEMGQDLSMQSIMAAVAENKLMGNDLLIKWLMNCSKVMMCAGLFAEKVYDIYQQEPVVNLKHQC